MCRCFGFDRLLGSSLVPSIFHDVLHGGGLIMQPAAWGIVPVGSWRVVEHSAVIVRKAISFMCRPFRNLKHCSLNFGNRSFDLEPDMLCRNLQRRR